MLSVRPHVPTPTTPRVSSKTIKLIASLALADLLQRSSDTSQATKQNSYSVKQQECKRCLGLKKSVCTPSLLVCTRGPKLGLSLLPCSSRSAAKHQQLQQHRTRQIYEVLLKRLAKFQSRELQVSLPGRCLTQRRKAKAATRHTAPMMAPGSITGTLCA